MRTGKCRYALYTLGLNLMNLRLLIASLALLLAGCDNIPGMGPDPRIAQREADGKAIGGACRYALRGIEDCYNLNPKASKTAIFTGWKDMDQYMRENKMEGQAPAVEPDEKPPVAVPAKPADKAAATVKAPPAAAKH
jgi:hypothetical protein